jgi:hypothetical protein
MKLGPHYMNGGPEVAAALLALKGDLKPSAVKFAQLDIDAKNDNIPDDPLNPWTGMGLMRLAAQAKVPIVGRRIEKDFDICSGDIDGLVEIYWKGEYPLAEYVSFSKLVETFPQVDYWECVNEPCVEPGDEALMQRYAKFMAAFARKLYAETGKKAVLGNWGVGTPDFPLWKHWGPVLQVCKEGKAILGRHSYGKIDEKLGPYYGLRHRMDEAEFRKLGYANTPVMLTEAGLDTTWDDKGNVITHPWRETFDADPKRFWDEYLREFVREVEQDSYVLCMFPFTCGTGQASQWDAYNYGHDLGLIDAIQGNPPGVLVPLPPVVIQPVAPPDLLPEVPVEKMPNIILKLAPGQTVTITLTVT